MKEITKNKTHLATALGVLGLLALSWIITLYFWDKVPGRIPTHFGFSGQPDAWAEKSVFWLVFIPGIQTALVTLFAFLYQKPQYSDVPTTLLLMSMPEGFRQEAFRLIRIMLLGTALAISALFTYLNWVIFKTALSEINGPNPWLMGVIMVGLFAWLILWTIKVIGLIKKNQHKIKN